MAEEVTDETEMDEGWEEVEYHEFPEIKIDFDKTPIVQGVMLWRETVPTTGLDGQPRAATMYALVNTNGEEVGIWGSANLDPQLRHVEDGEQVRIEFIENKKLAGGKTMRRFRVLRQKASAS